MKSIRSLPLVLLGSALLILSFTQPALCLTQATDQLRTPAEGSPERQAILEAVRDEYKEGDDHPARFQVNYLKVHQGWAWIDVTPLDASGQQVADPAPLLFHNDKGKWMARDLNDVGMEGEEHDGPHDPSPKYIKALQKKYPGVPTDIIPMSAHQGDPIQTIRDEYATINKSAASYKTVKKDLSGFSAGGGTLIAYLDGPKIMKIVATHFGESGRAVEEYYYWDNQLIFIYRKEFDYNRPASTKVAHTAENRFYFNGDKMVRWIGENAKQVTPGTSEYLEKEKEYLRLSKEFTDGSRSQKPIIESAQ